MITSYDIYLSYNKAKKSKRISTEEKYRNRLSEKSLWNIDRASGYFNTLYSNIDIDTYMKYGFDTFKTFNYNMLLNPKIINYYKSNDKRLKRTIKTSKVRIKRSFDILDMPLLNYCKLYKDRQNMLLSNYLLNKIDSVIVVYCIYNKLISFNDVEESYLYNIFNQYNDWVRLMYKYEDYIEELDKEKRIED